MPTKKPNSSQNPTAFNTLTVVKHPLIADRMRILRDTSTGRGEFREASRQLTALLIPAATQDLSITWESVNTPLATTSAARTNDSQIVVTPILRAGLVMADAVCELIPKSATAHVGIRRDPNTHKPVRYLTRLPESCDSYHIVVDPMLATGGSAIEAIRVIKDHYYRDCISIRLLCLVAAPEGVSAMATTHPDVHVFTASLDEGLDDNFYIIPGLGDAGDRAFGTEKRPPP